MRPARATDLSVDTGCPPCPPRGCVTALTVLLSGPRPPEPLASPLRTSLGVSDRACRTEAGPGLGVRTGAPHRHRHGAGPHVDAPSDAAAEGVTPPVPVRHRLLALPCDHVRFPSLQ